MPHTPKRGRGGGRGGRGGFSRFSGQGNVLGGTSGTSSPRGSPFPFRGGRGGGRGRGGALSVQGQNAVGFDYSAIAIRGQEDSEEDFVIEPPKGYVHQARPHLDSAEAASNANASPRPGPSQPNSGTATPTDTQHGATVIPIGPRVGSPYTIRGGTRGRGRGGFSAAPVFPSFVTSRGATSGRSASGGLGFRPLPQTEDEQYLAGVPGKGQRARGSSARSGDPADERPLLRPVEFVKSTGDWDNGRFRMHGEKATDAAEDESATQGYEHEETMPPYEHTTTTTEEIAEQALGQQSGSIVEDGEDEALIESLLQAYPGSRELGADEELDSTTQAVISMAPAPDAPQLSVPNGDDSSSLPTLQEDAIHVHDVEMESDAPVASTESAAGTSQMMLSSRPHTPLAVHITTESYTSSEPGTLRGRPRSTSSVSVGHTTHAHSTAAASGASSDAVTPLSQHPGLGSAQQHASSAMNGFGSQPPGQLGSELVNGLGSADMPDTEQSPRAVALEEHGQGADDLGFVIDTVGDHTLAERQSLETNTQSSAPIHRPGGFVLGDTTPVNERGTSRRGRIAPHGLASTHAPAPAPVRAAPTTPSVSQPKPALNHQESEDEDEEIILIPRSSQQPQHQVQLHHQQSGAQWRSAPGVSSDTDEERQLDAILEQARSQGGRLGLGATPVSIEHATATATIDLTGSPPPPDSEASARNFASVNGTLESASALAKDAERNDQESGDDDVNWTERQPRGEGKKRRNAAKKARRRQRAKGSADAAGAKPPVPREGDSDLEWGSDGPPGGRRAAASEARESGNKLGAGDVDDVQMRALSICSDLPATRDEEERMTRAALEASLRDDAELNALASKAGRAREEKASGAAAQGLTAAQKAAKNKMRGGARAKRTMPSISLRVKAEKDKDRARANALSRREEELVILADYMENALGNNSDTEEDSDVVVERGAGAALNGKEDEPTEMDEMLNFMRGMDAGGGGRHVTIDDIEDARRIREEDEEMRDGADRGSSDEWLTEESDEGEDDGEEDGRGDKSKRAKRSASVSGEEDEEEDDSEDDDDDLEDAELAAALDAAERLVVDGSEAESESTDEDSGSDEDEDSSFDDEGQHPHSGIGMQRATVARGRGGKGGKKKGKGKGKGRQYDESESEESDEVSFACICICEMLCLG